MIEIVDIICRWVRYRGWFYVIVAGGKELARGEFQPDALTAMLRGQAQAEKLGIEFATTGPGGLAPHGASDMQGPVVGNPNEVAA